MNHIYKSIFNKALGVFTAVPEFASAHGKGSERTVVGRVAKGTAGFAASALAISVGLALTSTSAVAGPGIYVNDGTDAGCAAYIDTHNSYVGIFGVGAGNSIALNNSMVKAGYTLPPDSYLALDQMKPCLSSTGANAAEHHSTQTNRTLFYGNNAAASVTDNGAKNLTLGGRLDVNSGIIGVGDRGVNGGSGATNSIRMGTGTTLADANKVVNGIAIGVNTQATQNLATAIGANAVASGNSASQALGYDAVASGKSAIAHGFHSHADGQSSIAIGDNAKASGIATVSLGFMANGHSEDGDKDNTPSSTKATYGTAVGHFAGADYVGTDNARTTALGNQAGRYGEGGAINTAVGNQAGQYVKGSQNVAMGHLAGSGTATDKLEANNTVSIGSFAKASGNDAIAMGRNALAGNEASMALGYNSNAKGLRQVSIGQGAGTLKNTTDSGAADATFIGNYAGADSASPIGNTRGIAVGTNAGRNLVSGVHNIAVGYDAGKSIEGSNNVAIGYNTGSNVNGDLNFAGGRDAGNSVKGEKNIALGYISGQNIEGNDNTTVGYSSGNNVTGWGNFAGASKAGQFVEGYNNVAIGYQAGMGTADNLLKTSGGVSISTNSKAKTSFSIAIGDSSSAGDDSTGAHGGGRLAIAIGQSANANFYHAIALGHSSRVSPATGQSAEDGIAIGSGALVDNYKGIAVGAYSRAKGRQSTVIANNVRDSNYSTASGDRSQVYGVETTVSGNNSVAIGDTNNVASARTYAIGNNINVAAGTDDSLVFGTKAAVGGNNAIAMGNTATASASGSVAISNQSKAKTTYSIALGQGAVAGDDSAGALNNGEAAIAIGREASANVYNGIALGKQATVKKDSSDGIAIGSETKVNAYKGTAIGAFSEANGSQSLAMGNNRQGQSSIASGERSQVYGVESTVSGNNSVAIGDTNKVASASTYVMGNNINVAAGADDSLAFGTRAAVGGANAIALGNTASAATNYSIAVGQGSSSTGDSSIAIGKKASAKADSAVAHGDQAEAIAQSSTAIGFKAKAQGYEQVSIGSNAGNSSPVDAVNYGAVFIGRHAGAGNNSATGNTDGVSIGSNAGQNAVSGIKNVAVGPATGQYVEGNQNLALSFNAGNSVKGDNNLAMMVGAGNNIEGGNNIAIGTNANSGTPTAKRVVTNSIAMGANTQATSNNTMAIGPQARALAADAVALGLGSLSNHANSVALGAGSATSAAHTGDYTLNTSYTAAGLPNAANGTVSVGSAGKERQIQNVAAGVISATSTDAINGSQLYATNNYMNNFAGGVKNVLGGDAAVDNAGNLTMSNIGGTGKGNVHEAIAAVKGVADTAVQEVESENPTALSVKKDGTKVTLTPNFITGDLVNADGTVNAPATADEGKLVSAKTVADALKANHFVVDTKGNTETGSEADAKVGSGNKVTFEAGNNLVAKQANTANGGATVKFSLKDDISLNSVTAGTGANQVVLGNDGVKVGGNTYINKDGLNANGNKITNVADGVNPKDAVNKGQLDAVKNVADSAVQSVDVVANENNLVVDNTDPKNPKLRLRKAVDLDSIKLENNVGEKSFLNSAGLTIKDGPAVTRSGINANNTKVTNVTDGDVNATSKDAVNGSQLYNVASNVKDLIGPDAAIDPATGKVTVADPTKGIGETGKGNIGDAIKAVNKAATAAKTTVKEGDNITVTPTTNTDGSTTYTVATKKDLDVTSVTAGNTTVNTNGLTITGGPSVTRGGIDAGNAVITNVRDGKVEANSKDAVNGGQLHATNTKLDGVKAKADTAVQDVKSGDENALTAVKDPNTNIVTVTPKLSGDLVDADGNITAPATPADKGKLVTAGTVAQALANTHFVVDTAKTDGELDTASKHDQKIKAGNKVTLQAGKNLKAKQTNGTDGAQVEFSLKDSISLTQVTAGTGDNQVVLGNDGVQVGGNTYINKDGLNANNKPISNVADGVNPKDAVNKGQLDAVKGVADSAVKSVDVANGEQNLVVDNTDPKNPKLSLKKDLTLDSVTAGDSKLATDGLTIAGGPSVKKDGINAADKKITNVAPGEVTPTSKDAVNGSQLYNVADNVKDLIGPDAKIDPATGKVAVADPTKGIGETGKGTIGEAIKSVKDKADTAVQDIKSGDEKALSVTKAGNTYTITPNLSGDLVDADGKIAAPTTDADKGKLVTAGTVAQALANTHFVVDTKATDGELDSASQADQKVKAGNKVTLQAGKNLKAKQTNGTDGAQVEFSLKDSISLTQVTAGTGDNQVVLGNDGVQVGGNTYINKDGLNANNKPISNVADGVNPKDAVNKGQLDAVKGVADSAVKSVDVANGEQNLVVDNSDPKNPKLSLKKDLTVDSVKAGDSTLNNDGLTIAGGPSVKKDGINAGDKTITNVAPGAVTPTSKDAVNGGQLYNVANNVKDLIGPDATIDPATGKVTVADPAKGIGETGKGNIGDAIKHVNDAAKAAADTAKKHSSVKAGDNIVVTEGTNAAGGKEYTVSTAKDLNVDSVKAGDTTVNNDGLTIAGGPSVKKDGIDAGDKKITNVADGVDAADAVNKGQLDKVAQNVVNVLGGNATVNGNGDITMSNIGDTGKGNVNDAIKAVNDLAKKAAAEKTSVKAKDGRSNVTVTEGVNAAGGHEYTVDVERAVTEAGSDQVTVTSKHDADSNTTTYTVDVSDKTKASLAKADSAVQGLTSKDGNLNFNKDPNGNVEVSFNDNLNVKNVTTDRVQVANGPSMTKDGINAAGKAISNVANGNVAADSKDAVNGGQLHETAKSVADVIGGGATVKDGKVVAGQNGIGNTGQNTVHGAIAAINQNTANNFNQIRGDLRKMDRDLRGGIAGALATAGLPQAFRPGKSMVAAAASTYRGQSGLAIGVSRISDNGKIILKVTGNTNSRGDFGGTIGAGYQW